MRINGALKVHLEVLEELTVSYRNGQKRVYQVGEHGFEMSFRQWVELVRGFRAQKAKVPVRAIGVELDGERGSRDATAGRPPMARAVARQFLLELLMGGPVPVAEGRALAADLGISEGTLRRARRMLSVESYTEKPGPGSVYYWRLDALTLAAFR